MNPFFMLSGALLTDSFDGPELDAILWSRPPWLVNNHKTIGVKIENGHLGNEQWVPVGPSHSVRFNHTHIELKVDVNIPNIPVQMAVDNVRLYPNPAHNPVTIVVSGEVSGNRPKLPIHNQKVQIFEEGSKRLLGEALTDEGGEAHVSLRSDVLYPVAAAITVRDGTTPIVQSELPRRNVTWLHPGDVWALDLRHKRSMK